MKEILRECIDKNKELISKGLSFQNFGNLSIKISKYEIIIKPSGVDLNSINVNDVPVIDIRTGKKIKGRLKPSIDTPTHIELYKKYEKLKSIAHCHSKYSTSWSQACKDIPILGTTHSDFSNTSIPVTDQLSGDEIKINYEKNIGVSIIKKLRKLKLNPYLCPGILVANHASFSWGITVDQCINNMETIEFLAETAFITLQINKKNKISKALISKHFNRKHGINAYYGQKKK
tara:strand:+ start:462 stop:1157 length:696 start_codon:yes stop_codon:yes gene_type:complete